MSQRGHLIYRLDGIEIHSANFCLRRDGQEQYLRQKTFQVLIYLLEQRQRLVTKEEVIKQVWPDTAVTDNALDQCLGEIRRALGDDSRNPRFLKTVPRVGYRFIGPVEEIAPAQPVEAEPAATETSRYSTPESQQRVDWAKSKPWFTRPLVLTLGGLILLGVTISTVYFLRKRAPASLTRTTLLQDPTKQSVAVMFFENQSGSADLDWLREGLADMMITGLSRSKKITVLSRQQLSVLLNRSGRNPTDKIALDEALQIARHSQAKLVVLGTFARLGDQIRIDVYLHNLDGQLLTAERLVVEQPPQILTQVDLLSLKLATYLGASESENRTEISSVMTSNLEAYRYYSLGVEKAQEVRNEEAIELLQKAIALDPNFAMAHARIGYVHAVKGAEPERGRPFLEKAYQLSHRLTEKDRIYITAWYSMANFDFTSAISSFRQALANYPLDVEAYAHLTQLLRGENRHEEALEVAKQGLVIDVDAKELYNGIGFIYSDRGRHDEAIAMFRRYVELSPNEPNAHDSLGLGLHCAGRYAEAIVEYERALQIKPDFHIAVIHLGNTYFQQGRYQEAVKQFQRFTGLAVTDLDQGRGWYSVGVVYQRQRKLEWALEAGKSHLKHRKDGADNLFLLALERGDLADAKNLLQIIEARQNVGRGARGLSRALFAYRGYFELRSGNAGRAIEVFTEALKHPPTTYHMENYEDCLANAYLELRRYDEAIAEYERILKLNPNYPLVHYHLAQAYEGKKQRDQARAEYSRFLEVWKDADADIPEVLSARKTLGQS
jgi:tetratricopeptide (TPR) repeat protein/DNA-binding winged helix-turn-helix (wHTH) protein